MKILGRKDEIKRLSESYLEEQLEYLKKFSEIDCPTKNIEGNKKVVEILREILGKFNNTVEEIFCENIGTHMLIRIKPENPSGKIILSAHLDTATAVFNEGDAEKHPFRIEGDWAYGIGIADCKGGVLTSIYAVRIMQEQNLLPNKEIVIILNADEETGSGTSKEILARESKDAEFAFVFEPTRDENCIITSRSGVGIFNLKITGKGGHPCIAYDEGKSAAQELAYQTVRLYEKSKDGKDLVYDVSDMYSSGPISEKSTAKVVATLRSKDGTKKLKEDIKEIEENVFVEGCSVEVDLKVLHPSQDRSEKTVEMYNLINKAGSLIGFEYPEKHVTGAGDGCLFSGFGVPTIDGLGPYMKEIHTFNERVYIPSIVERTNLMALVLGML